MKKTLLIPFERWPYIRKLLLRPLTVLLLLFCLSHAQNRPETFIEEIHGGVSLWYNSSSTNTVTFLLQSDTCRAVYPTPGNSKIYMCITDEYWGSECSSWGAAAWNTGDPWGYDPDNAKMRKDRNEKPLLSRLTLLEKETTDRRSIPVITIQNPGPYDEGKYILGFYWSGGGYIAPRCAVFLRDMEGEGKNYWEARNPRPQPSRIDKSHSVANPTYEDTLAIETGFSDTNVWIEWMKYNAQKQNFSDCYVCGKARPHLGTVPLHIPSSENVCFLSLFTDKGTNDAQCERWKKEYPILTHNPGPADAVTIYPGNYTCYISNNAGGRDFKTFPPGYCSEYRNATPMMTNQTRSLGDIYWVCGDLKIRSRLAIPWKGQCALAKVIMPLHMITKKKEVTSPKDRRHKRETPGESFDPHVYLDAIGIPRGVPNEFKARSEVAAGFESLLPIITINKNVAWINYIYYNQQRFVNYTRDALQGISDQLGPTSQMAFQNRLALDMILAEKGGVCVYLNKIEGCCTYIPDNTGPNGKITLAIKKLEGLAKEMKENSGISDLWSQYFGWLGSWKQALVQFGILLLITFICIIVFMYVIAPCFSRLLSRKIAKNPDTGVYASLITGQCNTHYDMYLKIRKEDKNQNLRN